MLTLAPDCFMIIIISCNHEIISMGTPYNQTFINFTKLFPNIYNYLWSDSSHLYFELIVFMPLNLIHFKLKSSCFQIETNFMPSNLITIERQISLTQSKINVSILTPYMTFYRISRQFCIGPADQILWLWYWGRCGDQVMEWCLREWTPGPAQVKSSSLCGLVVTI